MCGCVRVYRHMYVDIIISVTVTRSCFEMRIGHKKDVFISAMRFNFTLKYRFQKNILFIFVVIELRYLNRKSGGFKV